MDEHNYLPETGRVSVLVAIILLAFALSHFIPVPEGSIIAPLVGIKLTIPINLDTLIAILTALIATTGMEWLLKTHPSLQKGETREHWLLPALTVFVMGIALNTLDLKGWWVGFGLALLLLVVVFLAEYIVVDPQDHRYRLATALLTALAFAIFLILAISLEASGGRLFLTAPALFMGGFLVALRTLHLQLNERWEISWAIGIGFLAMQIGTALHYSPLTPVHFGLSLLAPVYACTFLAVSLLEGFTFRRAIAAPGVMLLLILGLIAWFR